MKNNGKSPTVPISPKSPKPSPKNKNPKVLRNKAMAESAYGNVFPVGKGGSTYNRATRLSHDDMDSIYKGTVTPQIKKISSVIESRGYKLLSEIGTGNYATVYSAVNKKNKMIALKVINLSKASNNYRLKFLPRELKVMSRIRHPNIVSIYEILQSTHSIYILMEFAPNGTLAEYIRKYRSIPEDRCKQMFKSILEGIHYMHSLSISHRDIKVENIILDHKMSPKITDFSYSKAENVNNNRKRDLSRTFCGSLPYLSPEILQQKSYDPLVSDVWSLGITLYIMLCDALPFSIKNLSQMLDNQLSNKWKIHRRVESIVSNVAKDIVKQMLEPDVTKRKTTTVLLLHRWVKTKN